MDIAKENFFEVNYNTKLDRLSLKKEGLFYKFRKLIKKHKFMTTVFITFALFSSLNFTMIFSFFRILQNI